VLGGAVILFSFGVSVGATRLLLAPVVLGLDEAALDRMAMLFVLIRLVKRRART
jgi:hypothetical protein